MRRALVAILLLWTTVTTILRAIRLPNDFSKEHWLVDYRFGFVKRGLVGTIVSLTTQLLHARQTERLVDILASLQFGIFCVVLVASSVYIIHRSGWSTVVILALVAFLSSPFMVMSAHLNGYYDNIIVVLICASLVLLLRGHVWSGAIVQAISILVHENSLLIGFPVFCWSWWLLRPRRQPGNIPPAWPLMLPIAAFVGIVASQTAAPPSLEQSLTAYLSTYPFVAKNIADVRVPHWITITLYDSYVLHQGQFLGRILSQSMIALVLPTLLALLGVVFHASGVRAASGESLATLGLCLVPQTMHVMAWDTARIWTYSLLVAFFLLWVYVECEGDRAPRAPFVVFVCLIAILVNAIQVTPLMDGLHDRFDVTTRLLLYAPVIATAWGLARHDHQPQPAPTPTNRQSLAPTIT